MTVGISGQGFYRVTLTTNKKEDNLGVNILVIDVKECRAWSSERRILYHCGSADASKNEASRGPTVSNQSIIVEKLPGLYCRIIWDIMHR